ncbi:Uncharacterised protein [Klebsiella pneumoniae]|nr:Uncharacterised protein [Klebsiella pneumoniae]
MGGVDVVAAQRHPKQRLILRQQPCGVARKEEFVRRGAQFIRVGNGEKFDIGQAKIAQRIAGSPPRMAPTGHRPQLLVGKGLNGRFRLIHKLYGVVPL